MSLQIVLSPLAPSRRPAAAAAIAVAATTAAPAAASRRCAGGPPSPKASAPTSCTAAISASSAARRERRGAVERRRHLLQLPNGALRALLRGGELPGRLRHRHEPRRHLPGRLDRAALRAHVPLPNQQLLGQRHRVRLYPDGVEGGGRTGGGDQEAPDDDEEGERPHDARPGARVVAAGEGGGAWVRPAGGPASGRASAAAGCAGPRCRRRGGDRVVLDGEDGHPGGGHREEPLPGHGAVVPWGRVRVRRVELEVDGTREHPREERAGGGAREAEDELDVREEHGDAEDEGEEGDADGGAHR